MRLLHLRHRIQTAPGRRNLRRDAREDDQGNGAAGGRAPEVQSSSRAANFRRPYETQYDAEQG